MAIAPVQHIVDGGNAAAATTFVLTVPALGAAMTVGNHMILTAVISGTATGFTSCVDSKGNTWQVDVSRPPDAAGNAGVGIASSKFATALVAGDTITMTLGASSRVAAWVDEYSGIATASWLDKTSGGGDGGVAGTAADSGATATTSQADELLIGAVGINTTFSAFTPEVLSPVWTVDGLASTTGTVRNIEAMHRIVSATGAYAAKATWTTSRDWTAAIATYKAAAGGAGAVLAGSWAGVSLWGASALLETGGSPLAGSWAGVSLWGASLTPGGAGAALAGSWAGVSLWAASLTPGGGAAAVLAGSWAGISSWTANLTASGPPSHRLRDVQYHAIIFAPDANGGPGLPKYELDADMLNVTWQQGLNFPGQAAFSMARFNPKLSGFAYMQDHIKIYREDSRGTRVVFAGKLVKPSESAKDAIVYCWDYVAFLQRSRTGYRTLYPEKTIKQIVDAEWALALAAGTSLFAFVATGTTETPLGLDGITPIKTNNQFGVVDFDRLYLFNALAEISMANTANTVVFEITREAPHTFNFWKNRSTQRTSYNLVYPGNLVDYALDDGTDQIINDLATVILDPTTGAQVEYALADVGSIASGVRRLQGATTIKTLFGITSGVTESDQQKAALARMLTISAGIPRLVTAFPRQNEISPFDGWDLGDAFRVTIQKADRTGDRVDAYLKATGIAAAWSPEAGELIQMFLR